MAEFLDYDPLTGVSHWFAYDETTGNAQITTTQDVSPVLDYTHKMRNASDKDVGIKKGWWLYAKIPAVVQLKMHAKGIDIKDPTATKRIIQEINEHYPALKCTPKNDSGVAKTIWTPTTKVPDADQG